MHITSMTVTSTEGHVNTTQTKAFSLAFIFQLIYIFIKETKNKTRKKIPQHPMKETSFHN